MANFTITASLRDEDGDVSKFSYHSTASTLAAVTTSAQTVIEAMDLLTGAKVEAVSITADVDISGWTLSASAAAGSDVEIGGRFNFASAAGYRGKITIPGFLKDTFALAGGLIDVVDATVAAFIANMESDAYTGHYEIFTDLISAYEVFSGKR